VKAPKKKPDPPGSGKKILVDRSEEPKKASLGDSAFVTPKKVWKNPTREDFSDNKENIHPNQSTPLRKKASNAKRILQTPRKKTSTLIVQDSPEKSPINPDFVDHSAQYLEDRLSYNYKNQHELLSEQFMDFLQSSLGVAYDSAPFTVCKNTMESPYQLISINTHSTFCDRNHGPEYAASKGFMNALTQCCSLATRREGMSVIFLRNPSKQHLVGVKDRNLFCRTSEPNDSKAVFCIDCVPTWINEICESIESIYVSLPKDGYRNKSLVVNTGFFTVEGPNDLRKTMAVITANGIYQSANARIQMQKIEDAIKSVRPDISVMIIDMQAMPKVKSSGTLEHCETVFANLLQSISGSRPNSPSSELSSLASQTLDSFDGLTDPEDGTLSSSSSREFRGLSLSDRLYMCDEDSFSQTSATTPVSTLSDKTDDNSHPRESYRSKVIHNLQSALDRDEKNSSKKLASVRTYKDSLQNVNQQLKDPPKDSSDDSSEDRKRS